MTLIELIVAGIRENDMDYIRRAYTLLTGQVVEEVKVDLPKKRGRPKKVEKSEKPAKVEKISRRPAPLDDYLSNKYQSPDSSGPVKVFGNNFSPPPSDFLREKVSEEEAQQLKRIQSLLSGKEPEMLCDAECYQCKKIFSIKPIIRGMSKRWYCDHCTNSRR